MRTVMVRMKMTGATTPASVWERLVQGGIDLKQAVMMYPDPVRDEMVAVQYEWEQGDDETCRECRHVFGP